jgi:hypothetical protein
VSVILVQITKGERVKRRITVEERFRQNITFNQKQFGIGPLEPTDITTDGKYVHFLLEILLLESRNFNSICGILLRIL